MYLGPTSVRAVDQQLDRSILAAIEAHGLACPLTSR